MKPLPNLNAAFFEVRQQESRLKVTMRTLPHSSHEGSASVTNCSTNPTHRPSGGHASFGGNVTQPGDLPLDGTRLVVRRNQGYNGSRSQYQNSQTCKYCKKPGDVVDNCFKLQRLKQFKQQNSQP